MIQKGGAGGAGWAFPGCPYVVSFVQRQDGLLFYCSYTRPPFELPLFLRERSAVLPYISSHRMKQCVWRLRLHQDLLHTEAHSGSSTGIAPDCRCRAPFLAPEAPLTLTRIRFFARDEKVLGGAGGGLKVPASFLPFFGGKERLGFSRGWAGRWFCEMAGRVFITSSLRCCR